MKNIYLYGSGNRCKILLNILADTDYMICGIVDSDDTRWGMYIEGFKISSPEAIRCDADNDYVCVTFYSPYVYEKIWDTLAESYGVAYEKQLTFHDILYDVYKMKFRNWNPIVSSGTHKSFFDASWGLGLGGVEAWLEDIIEKLDRTNHDNFFLLSKKNQNDILPNVEKHILEFYYEDTSIFSLDYIEKGMKFLTEHAPCTIVFSRVNELMLAACLVKNKYPHKLKIIMVDHGSCDGMYRDILSYQDEIDKYVCVSSGIEKRLIEYGIDSKKISSMTVPIQYEKVFFRDYSLDSRKTLKLGYAGRLEIFEKRLDILLELIEELEKRKINYVLNIAGNGSFRDEIKDFISSRKLENRIILRGLLPRNLMSDFWEEQDIAINVSDNEGRPISNMEAMVYGAVPVVTDTVGIRDDVENGINGYIVQINDYHSMADKIEYLDKHREILPMFGKKAQTDMRKKMNIDDYMKFWLRIIK